MQKFYSHLIQAKELSALLSTGASIRIIEAGLPQTQPLHIQSRLPTARFFDIEEVSDSTTSFPYMLADANTFQSAMRLLRVQKDDTQVICYDRTGVIQACRVWWNLKVFGKRNVAVLDGGLPQWVKINGRVDSGVYENTPDNSESGYEYALDSTHYTAFEAVRAISSLLDRPNPQSNTQLLDVRPPAKFLGVDQETTPGLRGGHIPGAINLPMKRFLTAQNTFQDVATLKKVFTEAGVSLDEGSKTICYCYAGMTSCVGMLALELAGKKNVTVYDGSWSEYVCVTQGIRVPSEKEDFPDFTDILRDMKEKEEKKAK